MVGFALIVIIVTVALLFLLIVSIRGGGKKAVESYEIDSFLQSALQYTTTCEGNSGALSVQEVVFRCSENTKCMDGTESCGVLNSTLQNLSSIAWPIGPDRPVKGYELLVSQNGLELAGFKEGNITREYKGGLQNLPGKIDFSFKVYA